MRIAIILNGISRKRKTFLQRFYPLLQREFECQLHTTEYAGHAEELAATVNADVVIAAGGDGTMSQVLNGVMKNDNPPVLGLIPLGSGNDFARTLKIKGDEIMSLLKANTPRAIDIGVVEIGGARRYFINECSIGMGPEVVKRIEGSRSGAASLTYMSAILRTFFRHKPQRIEIGSENFRWNGEARVLAIANGKAFGHSIYIAPDAELHDGKLNMFLCKGIPLAKFLLYLQAIKSPKKIDDPRWLEYRTVESISVTSETPLPVEADGELIGFTPMTCTVSRKRIKILA